MADGARSTHPGVQAQLDRLQMTSPAGDRLGLTRVRDLLERVGRPQDRLPPTFHVAGTNGKGSTCAFLRAALEAAGHSVHVFTSPHLVRFNERIRVAGKLIEDDTLEDLLTEVLDHSEGIEPSFFEVTTVAAFLAFARTPADAAVIEVGLGGRLDATNVIEHPLVTGIANLGIDHQQFLGDTLAQIAAEKAGIAKPGVPLITMDYPEEAYFAIADTVGPVGRVWAPMGMAWDARVEDDRLHIFDDKGEIALPLPSMIGDHQWRNAALAVEMIRSQDVLRVPDEALTAAMSDARWPARLQLLGDGPLARKFPGKRIWVDGGHNREAALAIAGAMRARAPFDLIFALLANRQVEDVLFPLGPLVRKARVVPIPGHVSHDPRDIALAAQSARCPAECYPDFTLEEAIERLAADPEARPDLLIFGSLYLAGEVLALNEEFPT